MLRAVTPRVFTAASSCSESAAIVTDHSQYVCANIVDKAVLVIDTRNATKGIEAADSARC